MKKLVLTFMAVLVISGAAFAAVPETGIVKANRDFVTVVAQGEGASRQAALEQAWTDAVRIAVGMVLSAKSNLNNDELSENIIAHSRGVIEDFDILHEDKRGSRTTIYIQARVRREILRDEANKYSEAQVVKADTGRAVKAQMDDTAKDTTKSNKTATGVALLKEVFDSYGPEDFFSATLNPKIQYDKTTKKPYIQINEKFNQDLFWKEFLPRVRQALEGIALKKEKKFYSKEVRQANQQLPKVGYVLDLMGRFGGESNKKPYYIDFEKNNITAEMENESRGGRSRYNVLQAVIPNDNATYTAYYLPVYHNSFGYFNLFGSLNSAKLQEIREKFRKDSTLKDTEGIFDIWIDFIDKMSKYITFSITYLDEDSEIISVQPIHTGPRCFNIYRVLCYGNNGDLANHYVDIWYAMSFTPGYIRCTKMSKEGYSNTADVMNLFLGTSNYNQKYGGGYEVELDANELQQLDSMKFEIIYN
ncbi:MAG: hypothetical protein IJU07_08690 [Synergistaceae bacterium]|nr:hypothetical protein [Synergistaceae bacterium]